MSETPSKIEYPQLLAALKDNDKPFPALMLHRFSDLSHHEIIEMRKVWPEVDSQRKVGILEDLEELAETDTLVNFDDFAMSVLDDPDPMVRVLGIRLLWECERLGLVPILTDIMMGDTDEAVRAAAAATLGKFVLLGELDAIPDDLKVSNLQNLLDVVNGNDLPQVRQRALESLGYSCHPKIPHLIQQAYDSADTPWICSALFAMGRSADERWTKHILQHIQSPDPEIQFEAIRAAGELEISAARDIFMDMLEEEIEDDEVRFALIWSLSQLGGDEVKQKLEQLLEDAEDEDDIELLEKALENIELSGESEGLEMLDFDMPGSDEDSDPDADDAGEEEQE